MMSIGAAWLHWDWGRTRTGVKGLQSAGVLLLWMDVMGKGPDPDSDD